MPELIKLLPEGASVVAVIVVVVLFLKQQREQAKQMTEITSSFNTRMGDIAKDFQVQIDRITQRIFENEKETQMQMQGLFTSFVQVTRETISAVGELKSAVDTVVRRVESLTGPKKPTGGST